MNKTSILALALFAILVASVFALITPEKAKINVKIKKGFADIKAKVYDNNQKFKFEDLTDKAEVLSKIALVLDTETCTNSSTLPIAKEEKIKIDVKIKKGNADLKAKVHGNNNEESDDDNDKQIKFKTSDKNELISKIASILKLEIVECGPPPPTE